MGEGLRANEELGQVVAKKDEDMKKVHMELTKAIDYLIKEEELVRETAKAKEEVVSIWKTQGNYTVEANLLHRRLKHAKRERKEEAIVF